MIKIAKVIAAFTILIYEMQTWCSENNYDTFEAISTKNEEVNYIEEKYNVIIKNNLNNGKNNFELSSNWLSEKIYFDDLISLKKSIVNSYNIINKYNNSVIFNILRDKDIPLINSYSPFFFEESFQKKEHTNLAEFFSKNFTNNKLAFSAYEISFYPGYLNFLEIKQDNFNKEYIDLKIKMNEILLDIFIQDLCLKESLVNLSNKKRIIPFYLINSIIYNLNLKLRIIKKFGELSINFSDKNIEIFLSDMSHERRRIKQKEIYISNYLIQLPENITDVIKDISKTKSREYYIENNHDLINKIEYLKKFIIDQEKNLSKLYNSYNIENETYIYQIYFKILAYTSKNNTDLMEYTFKNKLYFNFNNNKFNNSIGITEELLKTADNISKFLSEIESMNLKKDEKYTLEDWIQFINNNKSNDKNHDYIKNIVNNYYNEFQFSYGIKSIGEIFLTIQELSLLIGSSYGLNDSSDLFNNYKIDINKKNYFEDKYDDYTFSINDNIKRIINGKYDTKISENDTSLDKIYCRIELLNKLFQKESDVYVWKNIYFILNKYEFISREEIINKVRNNLLTLSPYHIYYLKYLNSIFPNKNEIRDKNIKILEQIQQHLIYLKKNNNEKDMLFFRNMIRHLNFITNQEKHGEFYLENLSNYEKISFKDLSNEIEALFNYSDIIEFSQDIELKIIEKISVLKNESNEKSFHAALNYITFENNIINHTIFDNKINLNNTFEYKKHLFVFKFVKNKKNKFHIITPENKKITIFFNRDQFINDIENYENISVSKKLVISEIFKYISQNILNNSKKDSIDEINERNNILKLFREIYYKLNSQENKTKDIQSYSKQFELNKFPETIANSKNPNSIFNQKNSNSLNKALLGSSTGFNFLFLTGKIQNIEQMLVEGDHAGTSHDSLEIAFTNSDLFIDNIRSRDLLKSYPKIIRKLSSGQIALNLMAAGLNVWQAINNFKESSKEAGKKKRDLQVAGAVLLADSHITLYSVILTPFSPLAGVIGGFTSFMLISGHSIYSTVRMHQDLIELGVDEKTTSILGAFSLMTFGMQFDHSHIPGVSYANAVLAIESKIKNQVNEYNKNTNNDFYFTKIIIPKISFHYPFSERKVTISNCNLSGCSSHTSGGELLIDQTHQCQSHNIYPENLKMTSLYNELNVYMYKNQNAFNIKKYEKISDKNNDYYWINSYKYYDDTFYCDTSLFKEFSSMKTIELDDELAKDVPLSQHSNLIYVGINDQFKHGQSISYIKGDENFKNYFSINKGQHFYHLIGGNNNDYFEINDFYISNNIFINQIIGRKGTNIISLKNLNIESNKILDNNFIFIKQNELQIEKDSAIINNNNYKKIYEKLINNNNILSKNNLPETQNITHLFGSQYNDLFIGSIEDNFIYGNKGNDKIYGGAGNDILAGGEGVDELIGGIGSDTYIINKIDFLNQNENYDIINIYEKNTELQPFYNDDLEVQDIILTDINNLGLFRENNDLWVITKSDEILNTQKTLKNNYIKIAKIKNLFNDYEKSNLIFPEIYSIKGFKYIYDPNNITSDIFWLDNIIIAFNIKIKE
ncbi:calcium-binding protein [Silvanigrella aquatica]|uniref:Haemolysin-type calcium binding-related domain-containing protein n=1 Tax=Silvanigrella aquatica TaxID=1915309 RepID=A0A1L4CX46_9BACT|nr:calcium-binding protein [Silvanigrella aquatica]APJ02521.1 hypothetical protein AXG55_00655 [Silvanigrella aquatica]